MENDNGFLKKPESYWEASTPTTNYPALDKDIKVDVAVVGAGMVGITCAYLLQRDGINVALFDSYKIASGVTAYSTAKITSQHDLIYHKLIRQFGHEKASQYAKANEFAKEFIKNISSEQTIACDLLAQDAYVYTQSTDYLNEIEQETEAAQKLGISAYYEDKLPLPLNIKGAVRFANQAQFHPRKYLLGLASKLPQNIIYENTRIIEITDKSPYTLTAENGRKIIADRVVVASHYPFINKHALYMARIYQSRSYILAIRAQEKFPGGMYINAENPTRSLRAQLAPEGELIFIVGEDHKVGQKDDTQKSYSALREFAATNFKVLDIPYRWSTQDCMSMDGVPMIGQYSKDRENLYVATGFGKWGITNGTASALIIYEQIVKGKSPWDDVFSPQRITPVESAKEIITENANVAAYLIGGKLKPLPGTVELGIGEGKKISHDGNIVGIYKDEDAKIHCVDTTCTHMGCELSWNTAELSWDCPCHGSRFNYSGEVIHGPAVKPLRAWIAD